MRVAYLLKSSAFEVLAAQRTNGGGDHARVRSLLRRKDPTVARLLGAHEEHTRTVAELLEALAALGAEGVPYTQGLEINKRRFALAVSVGGDGTLLRLSKSVADVPMLGINSAPSTSVGYFCGAKSGGVRAALERALDGKLGVRELSRMQVSVGGKVVSSRVLNDALFCHLSPAATSRYLIEFRGVVEEHKSSGLWVGPAAGSTAAQRSAGGRVLPLESRRIQLVVREPYTPMGETHRLLRVVAEPGEEIVVRNKMRESAIFLDGPDIAIRPRFGDVLRFKRSDEPLLLCGIPKRRRSAG
ncbi:MAG: NAD(+)/NADH kinase [Polyangiaceae bacterium]